MANEGNSQPWLILLVDDEDLFREMLQMWVHDLKFDGRPISIMHAKSGHEALQILRRSPNVALVILDQVMDTATDGIETALKIRHILGLKEIRIILSTAMNESLPRLEVLQNEEINDIQYKTDLNVVKFQSLIITNLRNYRDLTNLQCAETLSTRLLQVNNRLQVSESEDELLNTMISGINYICASIPPDPPKPNPSVFYIHQDDEPILKKGSGKFERLINESFIHLLDEQQSYLLQQSLSEIKPVWQSRFFIYPFLSSEGTIAAIGAMSDERWSALAINYLRLFISRIPSFIDRLNLVQRLKFRQNDLQRALQEREVLLREVHHRVKNNLQIISSLLSLDKSIERIQDRIYTMALVHDQLYHMRRLSEVDLVDYLHSLCTNLAQLFQIGDRLTIESASNEIFISYDRAIPLGLVINELVVNAAKYALSFKPEARIAVRILSESPLIIRVEDNGPGLEGYVEGTGLKLVRLLLEQLKGQLKQYYEGGQKMEIIIP
jgi:two-component sensor histidine kinase